MITQKKATTVTSDGTWTIALDPVDAGGPYNIKAGRAKERRTF
jgi:hypothetical protein